MNLRTFIRIYRLNISIFLFIILFSIIHYIKPSLIYNKDGSFRKFGVGYRDKTVISIFIVSIILAILCYVFIGYYATIL
jgi:hypothetical protein